MKETNLLVLSDIHFGTLGCEPAFRVPFGNGVNKLGCPISGIIDACKSRDIHGILVPGDLTSTGSPSEFKGAMAIVEEIASGLGLSKSEIVTTYGNHDVDWRIGRLAESTDTASPDPFYKQVASHIGPLFAPSGSKANSEGPVPGSGAYTLGGVQLYVLNSGFECHHDQKEKRGKISRTQLEWLETEFEKGVDDRKFHVLMVHHHVIPHKYPEPLFDYSILEESPQLLEIAGKAGVDLIIHGHCHHPRRNVQTNTGWKRSMSVLCSGSVGVSGVHRDHGNIPNFFHVVELTTRDFEGNGLGRILTFRYSGSGQWEASSYHKRNAPIDPVSYFGDAPSSHKAKTLIQNLITEVIDSGIQSYTWENLPYSLKCLDACDFIPIIKQECSLRGIKLHERLGEELIFLKP